MTSITRLPNLLSASEKLDNEQQYKFQTPSYVSLLVILAPVVIQNFKGQPDSPDKVGCAHRSCSVSCGFKSHQGHWWCQEGHPSEIAP